MTEQNQRMSLWVLKIDYGKIYNVRYVREVTKKNEQGLTKAASEKLHKLKRSEART